MVGPVNLGWLRAESKCIEAYPKRDKGGSSGPEAYPLGIGVHMACFPRQYLMRKPVLSPVLWLALVERKSQEEITLADALG